MYIYIYIYIHIYIYHVSIYLRRECFLTMLAKTESCFFPFFKLSNFRIFYFLIFLCICVCIYIYIYVWQFLFCLHNRKIYRMGPLSGKISKKFRPDFSIFFEFGGIFRYQNINIRIESFDFFEEFHENDPFLAVS